VDEKFRTLSQFTKSGCSTLADECVRVVPRRYKNAATEHSGLQKDLQRAQRCFASGVIAIETGEDVLRVPPEQTQLINRQCGPTSRDRLFESCLRQGYRINVPFHQNRAIASYDRGTSFVEPINCSSLRIQRRFG